VVLGFLSIPVGIMVAHSKDDLIKKTDTVLLDAKAKPNPSDIRTRSKGNYQYEWDPSDMED